MVPKFGEKTISAKYDRRQYEPASSIDSGEEVLVDRSQTTRVEDLGKNR